MLQDDLAQKILFNPLQGGADELYILSAYATPNMLSWYMKNIYHKTVMPIRIYLIVGMVPFDNLSVSIHEGFQNLVSSEMPHEISSIKCSYVIDKPAEHANLFIWCKDGQPVTAFMGSANFVQSSFEGVIAMNSWIPATQQKL